MENIFTYFVSSSIAFRHFYLAFIGLLLLVAGPTTLKADSFHDHKRDALFDFFQPLGEIILTIIGSQPEEITLPDNTAAFTAGASVAEGTIDFYLWEQVSGPETTMLNADSPSLELTDLIEGTYTFQVTVTDNEGDIATDQVTLTVNAAATSTEPINYSANPSSICGSGNVTFSAEPGDNGNVVR